jgi:hypothetical protein
MARLIDRSFDPRRTVVARRFFVAAGRHYNPGDTFDWRRMSVDQRRVRLLFEAGKLMHPDAVEITPADWAGLQAREHATAAPSIEQEMQDEDVHHIAVTAAVADEQPATPVEADGLDDLNMKELRALADAEGAPFRVSRDAQREAIREARRVRAAE